MNQRPEEAFAERVVASVYGGHIVQRDDTSRSAMVDFVLQTTDGSRVAVEVTTLTPERQKKFSAALTQLLGPTQDLHRTWIVQLRPSLNIKNAQPRVKTLLRDLEVAAIDRVDWRRGWDESEIAHRTREAGVIAAHSVEGPGWIIITNTNIGTCAATGEILTQVASDLFSDPRRTDNQEKLTQTGLAHRHLFIVVTRYAGHTSSCVVQALSSRFLPQAPPIENEAYTGVWVASDAYHLPVAFWTREADWNYAQV